MPTATSQQSPSSRRAFLRSAGIAVYYPHVDAVKPKIAALVRSAVVPAGVSGKGLRTGVQIVWAADKVLAAAAGCSESKIGGWHKPPS